MKFFIILMIYIYPLYAANAGTDKKENSTGSSLNDTSVINYDFPQINIISTKTPLFNNIPGSAVFVTTGILNSIQPVSGNEVLNKVSGLHIVEEEGAGLRANIGIRGLDPDRSRTVLMMEDGIPIALAPYGEPEMYYTPSIDRMKSIEILKGSGSILFGPQTIGGVINYITDDPPLEPRIRLNIKGGDYGFFTGEASYGTTINDLGLNLNFLHKQADKIGITSFDINDVTAKLKFMTGEKSRIGIKFSAYDERSNSTYIGLTQPMYEQKEYFKIIAPNDQLHIRRYSASLIHDYFFSSKGYLKTAVYGYTTERNWLRQDFSRSFTENAVSVHGDTTIPGGAVYMSNSTGNRNRQFEVAGFEPRIYLNYSIGEIRNDFEGGIRLHYERAFEQRIDGRNANALSGDLREDEIRTGYAMSFFAQNRFHISDKLIISPGIRLENFDYERDIFRLNYRDTSLTNSNSVFSVVPGFGVNYNLDNNYSLFAGLHRGFAPPRIKDAITNGGEALQLEAELSWNYELGLRAIVSSFLSFEVTAFLLDFSNQIIPVSESSGGTGTGLVNGGRTRHTGIENSIRLSFDGLLNSSYNLSLLLNSTFSNAEYSADRFIKAGNQIVNIKNNKLPYAPEYYFSAIIDIMTPSRFGLEVGANYIGDQFSDEINSSKPSANGETGQIPSYLILDLTGRYSFDEINSAFYLSVKNLLDKRYIVSRRPQGIKVGIPMLITAGVEINF